jgi:N-dimethylarginine dimethylaminohydrolase
MQRHVHRARLVIAPKARRVLIAQLRARDFDVVEIDINEIPETDDGNHCMA